MTNGLTFVWKERKSIILAISGIMALMLNKPPLSLLFFNKEEFHQYKEEVCLCTQEKGMEGFNLLQINALIR